jgi:secondary thiamine-phosphate synthase enzyme
MHRRSLEVRTRGRGTHDVTREIQEEVAASGVRDGLCHVFVHHTSASVIVCENADPSVRRDLEALSRVSRPTAIRSSSTTTRAPTTCPRTRARSSRRSR